MDTLGPRIKQLRLEAKLNKAALARRVGVSDVTISYWESGAIKQIGHERLVALAKALNCPLSMIIEGESGSASPLYLRSRTPLPWQAGASRNIDLPIDMVPNQRWDGECYLVTPAPGESFDFLAIGDLVAIAPTEIFRQSGVYLIEQQGQLLTRQIQQGSTGELLLQRQDSQEAEPCTPESRLQGKLVARWRAEPL
ncbi:helix-turn-helix domain-containing protein [Halomonas cerina]|uniref:Transcriptional regulator with XRE-family HTH domain n=1 Tax=Halomonas cerina TaxID=447424 RepID=A0A839VC02_9GAMM|nr:helix-turn-helix domain-containing protein [Halomonas cerina]MBB3191490.1 transcriptional regulator with XRE-family HTH domain [Halomonas cerina]